MARPIHLFVSSSPGLYPEREIVGEVIASLPLTIGWRIGHSPMPGEEARQSVAEAAESDLYVVILGHDFAAPMGAELRQSVGVGKRPLGFQKKCTHSPSAEEAARRPDVEWQGYSSLPEFRSLLEKELLASLLQRAAQLRLELNEIEGLAERSRAAMQVPTASQGEHHRGDAGRSGVILGREVWEE
jgi:hypothetical protein